MKEKLYYLLFAVATLPFLYFASTQVQRWLTKAAPVAANLKINAKQSSGMIRPIWASFAQGGEEGPGMFQAVIPKMKALNPQYIRIDHIYDFYDVVKAVPGGYQYDFSRLDQTVSDILNMGATPFFSLSYMPSVYTAGGRVIDKPTSWNDWSELIQKTIEHYSGKNDKNLNGVYYEVWNEPELPQFGNWSLSGEKDYRLLYSYAAKGAQQVQNTNQFYIGGPAVGSYYPQWVSEFLDYVSSNHLRLDFYSWHRYHTNPNQYLSDAQNIRNLLSSFPAYSSIPILLTEWGIDSENRPINNSNIAAAFTVATIATIDQVTDQTFSFELKDGPPPSGGAWGLITHERSGSPLETKPRYAAFQALNSLRGNKLSVDGQGTFVRALASKNGDTTTVVVTNYDRTGNNSESVPLSIEGLESGSYQLILNYPLSNSTIISQVVSTTGRVDTTIPLLPNQIVVATVVSTGPIAKLVTGASNTAEDQGLTLSSGRYILTSPEFELRPKGQIRFDIKPAWAKSNDSSFNILDIPYSTASGIINRLFLAKQKKSNGNVLTFGIASLVHEELSLSIPIDTWTPNNWHSINMEWDTNHLQLTLDGKEPAIVNTPLEIRNGSMLSFYPIDATIDNLYISLEGKQQIERNFNENTNL
jgi:hypothetical protein